MYMRPVVQSKPVQRIAQTTRFSAPVAGLIKNRSLSTPATGPQGAEVLENIFPTATGAVIRRGSAVYATLGGADLPVTALFSYVYGNNRKLFGATENTVYDITTVSSAINYQLGDGLGNLLVTDTGDHLGQLSTGGDLEVITGLTGGNWIDEQFATTGGNYLVIVNGQDPMQIYDGTDWYAITDEPVNRLNYDAETSPFTVGQTLTGGTSGATATITRVVDNGATGYLLLGTITGTFQDNETITDGAGGSATADGVSTVLFGALTGTKPDGSALLTSDFSYVWAYKQRLFFILKDSLDFYYMSLPDQITGTAELFRLGSELNLGGTLLIGATWSMSFGDGLQDNCLFISDEGEVVVYDGADPGDVNSWRKAGRYVTGKPRGPRAFIRAGGDLVIATDIGFVPLSQSLQTDRSVIAAVAVSYPIEDDWNSAVQLRSSENWDCIVWPENQMVLTALPTVNEQPAQMFVSNARTGAWTVFTGWSGTCLEIFNGRLFFGSDSGKVIEAWVTGFDQGSPFTATYVPLFSDFGNAGAQKIGGLGRLQSRGPYPIDAQISSMEDYIVDLPAPPAATAVPAGSEWDVGLWDVMSWGAGQTKQWTGEWQSTGGIGYALSPAVQITSGSVQPLDAELIAVDMSYDITDWGA